jgi:hypothetical protein
MTQTESPNSAVLEAFEDRTYAWVVGRLDRGSTPDEILGFVTPEARPAVARYLVQQGEILRSEFRSEEEAEAFWAHVGV